MTISYRSLALWTLGAVAAYVALYIVLPAVAHAALAADPAAPQPATGLPWQAWLALGIAALGSIRGIVHGVRELFVLIAPRTKTTLDDSIRDLAGRIDDGMGEVLDAVRTIAPLSAGPTLAESVKAGVVKILPGGTIVGIPPRDPQAGQVSLSTLAWLSLAAGGAIGAILITGALACSATQARQTTASAVVAALDCELLHVDADVVSDARLFADAKVQGWLSGVKPGDAAALEARIATDLKPIRSDLGRCSVAGALAAITVALTPQPGTAVSALSTGDPVQLRAAFAVAARAAGWAPVKVAGGTVL